MWRVFKEKSELLSKHIQCMHSKYFHELVYFAYRSIDNRCLHYQKGQMPPNVTCYK